MTSLEKNYMPKPMTVLHRRILSHHVLLTETGTDHNGSGILVEIADRIFVLTAAHVIDTVAITINLGILGQKTPFKILNKWFDSKLDVGFLELDKFEANVMRALWINPRKLSRKQPTAITSHATSLALCGSPYELKKNTPTANQFEPIFITCPMISHSEWPLYVTTRWNSEEQFALAYGEKHSGYFLDQDNIRIAPIDPHGLSGGGVWAFDPSLEDTDDPPYSLVGIQHHFYHTIYISIRGY